MRTVLVEQIMYLIAKRHRSGYRFMLQSIQCAAHCAVEIVTRLMLFANTALPAIIYQLPYLSEHLSCIGGAAQAPLYCQSL